MSKVEITTEMFGEIAKIRKGAIGVESNKGIVPTGIKAFYIIRMVIRAVINKKISIVLAWKLYKALTSFMANHVFIYLGTDEYVTIDAMPRGIVKGNLLDKIESGAKIKMYYKEDVTEEGYAIAKDWILKQLGERYSYQDFVAFINRLITEVLPNNPVVIENNKQLEHCSEISTKFMDAFIMKEVGKVSETFIPEELNRDNMHPQFVENYLRSDEAKTQKWVKEFEV